MRRTLCAVMALAVLIGGCATIGKNMNTAEAGVTLFHQQFNDQKVSEILSSADPYMFKTTPRDDVVKILSAVRSKLGKAKGSQCTNWNIGTFNMKKQVTLIQNTEFENGKGTETFVFTFSGNQVRLLSYNINSKELLLR